MHYSPRPLLAAALAAFFLVSSTFSVFSVDSLSQGFNRTIRYDIYYQGSTYQASRLSGVYIIRQVNINAIAFLEVSPTSTIAMGENSGFVRLDSITAIIPTGRFNFTNPLPGGTTGTVPGASGSSGTTGGY